MVTFDFENVPASAARVLQKNVEVYPPPGALALAQDRLCEKELFGDLNIPIPAFATVDSLEELQSAARKVGLPAVLKTRRLGYDGKGQRVLRTPEEIEPAWRELGGAPLILEGFVPFEREVSVLAARGRDGEIAFIRWWKTTTATGSCGCRAPLARCWNWSAKAGITPAACWSG